MIGRYLADGNIYATLVAPPVAGDSFNGGFRYDATGALYITAATSGTDIYVSGKRTSLLGQVVVGNVPPLASGRRRFMSGQVFDVADDTLGRQINNVPVASDPFINGLREGPNGGAYMNTIGPPATP